MQYTSPAWDNQAPPPLNASNLLDIGHALEALNITQDERSTLGAETTDKLGQIFQKIVQGTDSNISQLQTLVNEKGNCNIITGQYVGNGNDTSLSMPFLTRLYIDSTDSDSSDYVRCIHIYTGGSYLWIFNIRDGHAGDIYGYRSDCIVTDKNFHFYGDSEADKTYYYIALG